MRTSMWILGLMVVAPAMAQPGEGGPAGGQPGEELPVAPRKRERYPAASRMDLAIAYLRFERALREHPPQGDAVAETNRKFDEASLAFFSGRYNPAVETLGALVRAMEGGGASLSRRVADAVRVTPTAVVVHAGNAAGAELAVEPLFAVTGEPRAGTVRLDLVLEGAGGREAWRHAVELVVTGGRAAAAKVDLGGLFTAMPRGDFTVAVVSPAGEAPAFRLEKGLLTVREASVEPVKKELEARLAAVAAGTPEQRRALATARARVALLSDEGSTRNSARFLTGMDGLAAGVLGEVAAVEKGENPYRGRAGDHWRVVVVDSAEVPCRVYVPARVAGSKEAAPLVVAYHGAGGDESMFFEGYGAGVLRELAEEKGFIVACPLTYSGSSGRALDRVLEDLSGDYAVDASRVYALGHSMGAGAVAGLAVSRAGRLAGACCIAGGGLGALREGEKRASVLMVAGELDPLFGVARARKSAEEARAAGGNVPEFVEAKGWGHTLVVGSHLRRAVEWLLERRGG